MQQRPFFDITGTMSCYDPVTTTSSAPIVSLATFPPVNLSSVLESLASLQSSQFTPQATPQGSITSLLSPQPLDILVPPLSISTPLITVPPLSFVSAPPDTLLSPLSLHSQLSPLSMASNLSLPSSSQYNPSGPGALPLLGGTLGPFSPASSQLSPLDAGPSAFSRRRSAPEGLLTPPQYSGERRRYSDFNVQSILRRPSVGSGVEQRRASIGGRKPRTIYGAKQTEVLEEVFSESNYMVGPERELLAQRLGLSESQVRVWFQNRRSKKRKQDKQMSSGSSHDE